MLENIIIDLNEKILKALDVDPEYTLRDGFYFQLVFALKKSNITDLTDHVIHVGISDSKIICFSLFLFFFNDHLKALKYG